MNSYKPAPDPKTFKDQIKHLERHNIKVNNPDDCEIKLQNINYYRVKYYGRIFNKYDDINDKFLTKVDFDNIYAFFKIDRAFSMLILKFLNFIEKNLKSLYACNLSCMFQFSLVEDNKFQSLFRSKSFLGHTDISDFVKKIKDENDKQNSFIHNLRKYGGVPLWVFIEYITFGSLKYLVLNLDDNKDFRLKKFKQDFNKVISNDELNNILKIRNLISHLHPFIQNFKILSKNCRTFDDIFVLIKSILMRIDKKEAKQFESEIYLFLSKNKEYSNNLFFDKNWESNYFSKYIFN